MIQGPMTRLSGGPGAYAEALARPGGAGSGRSDSLSHGHWQDSGQLTEYPGRLSRGPGGHNCQAAASESQSVTRPLADSDT